MQITVDGIAHAMATALDCAEIDPNNPDAALDFWRSLNVGAGAILAFGEEALREAVLLREKRRGATPAVLDTVKRMLEAQAENRRANRADPDLPKIIIDRARHRLGLPPRGPSEERQP